jgi:hypothetical protein
MRRVRGLGGGSGQWLAADAKHLKCLLITPVPKQDGEQGSPSFIFVTELIHLPRRVWWRCSPSAYADGIVCEPEEMFVEGISLGPSQFGEIFTGLRHDQQLEAHS